MGWFTKRSEKKNEKITKRDGVSIALERMANNLSLSTEQISALYKPVVARAVKVLRTADLEYAVENLLAAAVKMLAYRRGQTLPAGIPPERVQKYREIVSFTLTLALFSRVIGYYSIRRSIECDAHGDVVAHNLLFTYVSDKEPKKLGITKAGHNILSPKVERQFSQWVTYDLLLATPTGMRWYGQFPDMLSILLEVVSGTEKTLIGEIVEMFVAEAMTGKQASEDGSALSLTPPQSTPAATKLPPLFANMPKVEAQQPSSAIVNALKASKTESDDKQEVVNAERHKPTSSRSSQTGQASSLVTALPTPEASASVEGVSPALAGLLGKIKTPETEPEEKGEEIRNANPEVKAGGLMEAFTAQVTSEFIGEILTLEHEQQVVALIPVKTYRQILTATFKHLPKERRKDAEAEFVKELQKYVLGEQTSTERITPVTDVNGEKWIVLKNAFILDDKTGQLSSMSPKKQAEIELILN